MDFFSSLSSDFENYVAAGTEINFMDVFEHIGECSDHNLGSEQEAGGLLEQESDVELQTILMNNIIKTAYKYKI